jgi:GNAT superfamily N-acetyltransferase
MNIQVNRTEYKEVEAMRNLYRQEANCQIVHDSFLSRGLADPYWILVEGRRAGYGAVANRYDKGRLMEFYVLPYMREFALPMCRELLAASEATQIEAQTNLSLMLTLLYDLATDIVEENILFHDAFTTSLACPDGIFRQATPEDTPSIFPHHSEPVGEWLLEVKGAVAATGGFLCHYNPPYGDVYMEVLESERRKGYGSYLVQEVKRVCYEAGKRPAARCNPANIASRRTLQKAGLLPCARMLAGKVAVSG